MLAWRARVLIATLWVGSLWTVGYLVAPMLFSTLSDKVLAGTIAGGLFRIEAWLSMVCATALIALMVFGNSNDSPKQRRILLAIVSAMVVCTLIGYFGLQPFMAELREAAGPGGVMESDARMKFGILHGLAAVFFLVQSLLGAALILKIRQVAVL
jgi:hypothetical protein